MNWDSIEELKSMRAKIDRRLNQLKSVERKSKKSHADVFESCFRILDTDITNLYEESSYNNEKKYYVYVHCDPFFALRANTNGKIAFATTLGINYLPFYVGKGEGNRAFDLNRNGSHRKIKQIINNSGKDIEVKIIKTGMTELEALMMESKLIDIFGLKSYGGWLANLDEGHSSTLRKELYTDDFTNVNKMLKRSRLNEQTK